MDVNNNTNTSPTRPTTNQGKNNDGDGVKAQKRRGRQKSVPLGNVGVATAKETRN
jgi:hypothetical protein